MTLHDEMTREIQQWRGLDAGEQTNRLPALVDALMVLVSADRKAAKLADHDEPGEPKLSKAERREALATGQLAA